MKLDEFHPKPWRSLEGTAMGCAVDVPTMLSPKEIRFYFWLARRMADVKGAIADLGCFAGGSTAYLAEGNRQGGGEARVFAFDQFTASEEVKQRQLYSKGVAAFEGSDILPLAKTLLAPGHQILSFADVV
jgi:SAM-dependent methyltransferase